MRHPLAPQAGYGTVAVITVAGLIVVVTGIATGGAPHAMGIAIEVACAAIGLGGVGLVVLTAWRSR